MVNLQGVKELVGTGDATAIIEVLSRVLTQLIDLNRNVTSKQQVITKFQSSYPPTISILAYLERINKYAKCSPNCFIVALIYIDRLIETRNVILSTLNVHRVLITSVMLATKVFDDEFYKNAYYAKLGGVSTQEINSLELEFLSLMNFDFFVTVETFEKYQKELSAFVSPSPSASAAVAVNASGVVEGVQVHGQGQEAGGGGAGGQEVGLGLTLTTPSPPALLSCGQYKTVSSSEASTGANQPTQPTPHLLGALGLGLPVSQGQGQQQQASLSSGSGEVDSVVVPLSYEECFHSNHQQQQQFATVTPPPLMDPSSLEQQHQQSYFPVQVQSSLDQQMQQQQQQQVQVHQQQVAQQQQQQLMYPVCGGGMFAHPPQQGLGLGLSMDMGNGMGNGIGGGVGLYSGGCGVGVGGHYITPVTTPTSVADRVFSWGGEGDGKGKGMGKTSACGSSGNGNGNCNGNGNGSDGNQQQRLHPPTQLFPTNTTASPVLQRLGLTRRQAISL